MKAESLPCGNDQQYYLYQKFSLLCEKLLQACGSCEIAKQFESIIKHILWSYVSEYINPPQFAYLLESSVQDAALPFNYEIMSHLQIPDFCIRVLFADFSRAFNTIQPHLLIDKLLAININSDLI